MKKIETSVSVAADGHLEFGERVETDLPPGRHRAVVLVEEPAGKPSGKGGFQWKMVDFSAWPADARFTREEIYQAAAPEKDCFATAPEPPASLPGGARPG